MKWSRGEDELLIALRRSNTPYLEKVKIWEAQPIFPNRTSDALRNRMNYLRNQDKLVEFEKEANLGVLDIETSNLKADVGWMISWAIYYPKEDRTVYDIIKKRHITNYTTDKQICKSLLKELKNVDILYTYYGTGFDLPYARTRCLMQGFEFPEYGEARHVDVYYKVRGKMKTHRKSLKAISEALGIEGKTPVPISVWRLAMLGHPESLEYVLEHNLADVKVTWEVFQKLAKYAKLSYKSI